MGDIFYGLIYINIRKKKVANEFYPNLFYPAADIFGNISSTGLCGVQPFHNYLTAVWNVHNF